MNRLSLKAWFFPRQTKGVFIIEVDESSLRNIKTEVPILTISRVLKLTNEALLDEVSCLMLSDTGLYLNWNPNALIADDNEEFEPLSEGDGLVGKCYLSSGDFLR